MKILIIRLSSIGDVVLTSPVIRCIKEQVPNVEIHVLVKSCYVEIHEYNPYISQIHSFDKSDSGLITKLKNENFDYILDLQNNHRSRVLVRKLNKPCQKLRKLNFKKWLLVNFKINCLPALHVVDRYMQTTDILPQTITNDEKGLDFFLTECDFELVRELNLSTFVAVAVGSQHFTKKIPVDVLEMICQQIFCPVVLLGGKEDWENGQKLIQSLDNSSLNLCGMLTIRQSAAVVAQSKLLLCGDTGLMHIAAALRKPIVSLWGNTVPAFGMYPYLPENRQLYYIMENKELSCRPCSKLGKKRCPKTHFDCMRKQNISEIVLIIDSRI